MPAERFFSRVRLDIFRPFTGRHRGIAFEVAVDLYDRLLGAAADYDLILNRERLTDIVGTSIAKNRDLIVRTPTLNDEADAEDAEFDSSIDDREYAKKLIARLVQFGIIESYSDATHLTVLWRFSIEGKRIAKMFSETRRRTASGRQRSIRACRTALESFLREKSHEYLVDAYEYSTSIFEDVCQVADMFNDHQRQLLTRSYGGSKEAIDDYNAGLALEGDDWRLLFNRANALRELGAYPQAVAEYQRALSQLPTNADIYYYRGLSYQNLGRMDEAVDDYNQAIRLNPARIEAYVNRGSIYAEAKQYDRAMKDFNEALRLDPDDADVHFNRGAVYRFEGKPDEALQEFSQSLSLQPSNAKTLNFRGMTYFGKGDFDSAINDYEKAISIEPANPFLYNNRGAAFYQKRDFDKAVSDYTVALSFAPNNHEALTNRAFAYCAMGRLDAERSDIAALKKLGAWIDPRLIELTGRSKSGTP